MLPDELSSDNAEMSVQMHELEERKIKFAIRNFSALKNSNYQAYILLEYEYGTIHYTKSLPMTIKVEDMQIKRNPLLKDSIFISLTLLLIVLSGAYIYKKRKNKR